MAELRIDLHVHTDPLSRCSALEPEEAIRAARTRGLDGICFTEHNRLWEAQALKDLADRNGFLVLQGIEVDTSLGHILVYGLEKLPPKGLDLCRLRKLVEESAGIMVAAHPFRKPIYTTGGYGLWSPATIPIELAARREIFRWVDAIEVSGGQTEHEEVQLTLAVGHQLGLRILCGSDAHQAEEVGGGVTVFHEAIETEADLIQAVKEGNVRYALS
jgi:predicted metal-dependent phosphoesterase TrpH